MPLATLPPNPPAEVRPADDATHHAPPRHPFLERADRWHAERRAWESADAQWGRVAPAGPEPDGPNPNAPSPSACRTAAEVRRLLGLPRVLLDALAPYAATADGNVYHPGVVAAAATGRRRLRSAK